MDINTGRQRSQGMVETVGDAAGDRSLQQLIETTAPFSVERERVERYIAAIFHASHDAKVLEYLPLLVHMEQGGSLCAALGLRSASRGPLFAERYLKAPLEDHIVREFARRVHRGQLMELGNLVSSQPGQAVSLYLLVVAALGRAGISHLLFAANRAVRVSIKRCGFVTRELGKADPDKLGADAGYWGSYYESDPRVVVADIPQALQHGKHHPAISRLWQSQALVIEALADTIRSERS
ncbi:MAG: thermostable hemolysin [Halioglobus sp.]